MLLLIRLIASLIIFLICGTKVRVFILFLNERASWKELILRLEFRLKKILIVFGSLSRFVEGLERFSRILFTCFNTLGRFNLLLRLRPLAKLCKKTSFSVSFLSISFWLFLSTFSHPGFGYDLLEAPVSWFNTLTCIIITINIKFKKIFLLIFAIALFTSTLVQRSQGPFKMFFKNLNFRRKMFFSNLTMGQILNRNGEGMNRRKWKLKNSCQILKN
jgi:hypothetical protein